MSLGRLQLVGQLQRLVGLHVVELLHHSVGPAYFHHIDHRRLADAEMQAWIGLAKVAPYGQEVFDLPEVAGRHGDARADGMARASRELQARLHPEPVTAISAVVSQQVRHVVQVDHQKVDVPVVVVVAVGDPAPDVLLPKERARLERDVLEGAVADVSSQRVLL